MKPVVYYDTNYPAHIKEGSAAYIKPINHPNHLPGHCVSNTSMVHTSTVLSVDADGNFETKNTRYVPKNPILEII